MAIRAGVSLAAGGLAAGAGASAQLARTVFSGHGAFNLDDGFLEVPEGTTINTYSNLGEGISDSLGNQIELGNAQGLIQNSYGPGDIIPNYTLYPGDNPALSIIMNEGVYTPESPVTLNELIGPNMGTVDWAACTKGPY
jgi:hypothetical protein